MNKEPWYSVRCIFEHKGLVDSKGATTYEERIVVLRCENLDDAITRGESEAHEYAQGNNWVVYTGFIDAYHLSFDAINDKTEVYSLMRNSLLEREDYLDHYYDSGNERTQQQ